MQIKLNNCGKSFNRKWLFRNINVTFNSGDKWVFLGANGSGKSTLTLLLAGQVWPTEGTINWQFNNQKIEPVNIYSKIALASPAMELPEEFSVTEICNMQQKMKPFIMANPLELIAQLCDFDNRNMHKPIQNFSSGMKQRFKICLAAFTNAPILILDEPLTNLDSTGSKVLNTIIENYTQNRLLVIASNRKDEYEACDKYLRIEPNGLVTLN